MPQLNNISFELSHVVFFPCLLMQAVGEVRLDEERSDELATPSLATKTTHPRASAQPPFPLCNHRNSPHPVS